MPLKLLVAESTEFAPEAARILEQHFEVTWADLDRVRLLQQIGNMDLLWVRLRSMIDAELMDRAPYLKAIVTNTTGLNHIDSQEAERRGIQVLSLKGEVDFLKNVRATAEHTLALTLALLRNVPAAHQHVCEGKWNRGPFKGQEIYGKTVGIIGYGRLGRIVAQYFSAFGAHVIVNSRDLADGTTIDGFAAHDLPSLLRLSDIVSLHVNYEPANRYMIAKAEFEQMKPGAYFVNTARGELVDEAALLDALQSNYLQGAALDVIDDEHHRAASFASLVDFARQSNQLILTPHIGGHTIESSRNTETFCANKLVRFVTSLETSGARQSKTSMA